MNEILQSIILGVIQGLGEFLPISSTAHLILIPYFFNWKDPGLAFNVALHAGTLIAVLFYFWRDWLFIIKYSFNNKIIDKIIDKIIKDKDKKVKIYNKNFFYLLIIATIPGVLAGYFLEEKVETILRHPLIIAFTLSFVGFILYFVDRFMKHKKNIAEINFLEAFLIGLAQAIAIIPGVSRSGATIAAGLTMGLNRMEAARFSFLMSTPIIFGATIFKIDYLFYNFNIAIFSGIVVSALSGYLAIKCLIKFVEKSSYAVFFWYRLMLAVIIVIVYFLKK